MIPSKEQDGIMVPSYGTPTNSPLSLSLSGLSFELACRSGNTSCYGPGFANFIRLLTACYDRHPGLARG